jgi:hypothetical protein
LDQVLEQGSGQLYESKKGLKFYTLGSTGFVAVTDVVRMAHQLKAKSKRTLYFD